MAARHASGGCAPRWEALVADPKNYTGIFPSTYGGSFITQDLISPLLQPFLRREEIRPEEIQPVEGSEAIRINPQTGMPEAIRDIEVVPGEYGPIESGLSLIHISEPTRPY